MKLRLIIATFFCALAILVDAQNTLDETKAFEGDLIFHVVETSNRGKDVKGDSYDLCFTIKGSKILMRRSNSIVNYVLDFSSKTVSEYSKEIKQYLNVTFNGFIYSWEDFSICYGYTPKNRNIWKNGIKDTGETEEIDGKICKIYKGVVVSGGGNYQEDDILYYADEEGFQLSELAIPTINLLNLKGLLVKFVSERRGMSYRATFGKEVEINSNYTRTLAKMTARTVDDNEFSVPQECIVAEKGKMSNFLKSVNKYLKDHPIENDKNNFITEGEWDF